MVASVIADGVRVAGEDLLARATRGAGALERLGVGQDDVVAVLLRNDLAFLEVALTLRLVGAYLCPINWHFKADEVSHILRDSGAVALIAHADLLHALGDALPWPDRVIAVAPDAALRAAFKLDPDACAMPAGMPEWHRLLADGPVWDGPPRAARHALFYSSGTTGRSKGIRRLPMTEEHQRRTTERVRISYGVGPGERTASVAPLYHAAPCVHGLYSLLMGELLVLHPRFDPLALLADVERHLLTSLVLVPTMLHRLLQLPEADRRRHDLGSLRFLATTGAPCPPEVKRAMIDWLGPIVGETYAASELGGVTFCTAAEAVERPGTVGRPLPGVELRIMDEAGSALPVLAPGLVYCRQNAMPDFSYIGQEQARAGIERDGMITLGDVGYLDGDGYLYLCDRRADLVISGGVNIYPVEIEAVLLAMPGIADCALFGIPDPDLGEVLAAHVVAVPGTTITVEGVRGWVAARLASFKVPRLVELVAELPREETGKIFKRRLKAPYWERVGRRV